MNLDNYSKIIWIIGSIIGFSILFFFLIYLPNSLNQNISDQLNLENQKLERDLKLISKREERIKQLEQIEKLKQGYYDMLLETAKPPVVAAQLQGILKNMAEEEGVKITREKQLDAIEHGNFLEIPVKLSIECTITRLTNFMYKIEDYWKYLDISNLNIKVRNTRNPQSVSADIIISGFIINKAALEEG